MERSGGLVLRHRQMTKNWIIAMLSNCTHMWDGHLAEIKATEHKIEFKSGAKSSNQIPCRKGIDMIYITAHSVQEKLEKGLIEPEMSKWESSITFVPKRDGKTRFF